MPFMPRMIDGQVGPQERFAAGQPDLLHAQADEGPHDPRELRRAVISRLSAMKGWLGPNASFGMQ